MPKIPETLLDKFAKLYHDRNAARKKFARIDKPKFQGVDMDKHRKWKAAADELIENDYKDYLKKMYQRFPNREAVREQFPEEYNAMPYLEELFPE